MGDLRTVYEDKMMLTFLIGPEISYVGGRRCKDVKKDGEHNRKCRSTKD